MHIKLERLNAVQQQPTKKANNKSHPGDTSKF